MKRKAATFLVAFALAGCGDETECWKQASPLSFAVKNTEITAVKWSCDDSPHASRRGGSYCDSGRYCHCRYKYSKARGAASWTPWRHIATYDKHCSSECRNACTNEWHIRGAFI
ncbi:MAG: hypothetical protein LBB08_02375 [Rickettsiales bacterium]|nr:hypothetical protein [Rickettsiales bacterium]